MWRLLAFRLTLPETQISNRPVIKNNTTLESHGVDFPISNQTKRLSEENPRLVYINALRARSSDNHKRLLELAWPQQSCPQLRFRAVM
jgi:hypothetical protein